MGGGCHGDVGGLWAAARWRSCGSMCTGVLWQMLEGGKRKQVCAARLSSACCVCVCVRVCVCVCVCVMEQAWKTQFLGAAAGGWFSPPKTSFYQDQRRRRGRTRTTLMFLSRLTALDLFTFSVHTDVSFRLRASGFYVYWLITDVDIMFTVAEWASRLQYSNKSHPSDTSSRRLQRKSASTGRESVPGVVTEGFHSAVVALERNRWMNS